MPENPISFQKSKHNNISCYLNLSKILNQKFKTFEIQLGLYPYSQESNAHKFTFLPYEEYLYDLNSKVKTSYIPYTEDFSKIFSLIISMFILLIFLIFKPGEILSIESVVSIVGAYALSKELWEDLERFLINTTKNFPFRFKSRQSYYVKDDWNLILKFFDYAREKRNQAKTVLADYFEYFEQSNSKLLSLKFKRQALAKTENQKVLLVNILTSNEEKIFDDSLVAIKLTYRRNFLIFHFSKAYLFAFENNQQGTVIEAKFQKNKILELKSYGIWRFRYYGKLKIASE